MRKGRSVPAFSSSTALQIPKTTLSRRNARDFSTTHSPGFVPGFVRPSKSASCRSARSAKPPVSWASPPRLPRAASFTPGSPCAKPVFRKQMRPSGGCVPLPDRKSFRSLRPWKSPKARRADYRVEPFCFRLPLLRVGRKLFEHFLDALVQILDVLVGVVGESVARGASPQKRFRLRVEQIDTSVPTVYVSVVVVAS